MAQTNLLLLACVVQTVFGQSFTNAYLPDTGKTKSTTGFLIEYFTFNSNPFSAFPPSANPTGGRGMAAYEDKYASEVLGSPSGRNWVRVSAAVTPSLEFNLAPSTILNGNVDSTMVPLEEWYGYYYPASQSVFTNPTWGMRISGIVQVPGNARFRVKINGDCWSYKLQMGSSQYGQQATSSVPTADYYNVQATANSTFVLDVRFSCTPPAGSTLSVRWIPQRWLGPSRVFLSSRRIPGSSNLPTFDTSCQDQAPNPPSLGTWKALLWGSSFASRFPADQLIFPLMHRVGDWVFEVGNLTTRDPRYVGQTVTHDSLGAWYNSNDGPIWINDNSTTNCGMWNDPAASGATADSQNTGGSAWNLKVVTMNCATPALFYCVEVFPPPPAIPTPPNCSSTCAPDVVACAGVCGIGSVCQSDKDCINGNCEYGICKGLQPNSPYCVASFSPCTPFSCLMQSQCLGFSNSSGRVCVAPNLLSQATCSTTFGAGANYTIAGLPGVYHASSRLPLSTDSLCPPRYVSSYSSNLGTSCTYSPIDTSFCCGLYLPCSNSCSSSLAANVNTTDGLPVRFVPRPYYALGGNFVEMNQTVTESSFSPEQCFNFCLLTFSSNCGSFQRFNAGAGMSTCRVSSSRVVKWTSGNNDMSWLVLSNTDQDFQPIAELSVTNVVPQFSFPDASANEYTLFIVNLTTSKKIFAPLPSAFFCLMTGVQCINNVTGDLTLPGEIASEFNFFLPFWDLALPASSAPTPQTMNLPAPFGLRHVDVSLNPRLVTQINQPSATVRTVEMLGLNQQRPQCTWKYNVVNIYVTRWAEDDNANSCLTGTAPPPAFSIPSLLHYVLHNRQGTMSTVSLTATAVNLQSLVVLTGGFPGIPANFNTNTVVLTTVTGLLNLVSLSTSVDSSMFRPSLRRLELYGVPQQTMDAATSQFGSFSNLRYLTYAGLYSTNGYLGPITFPTGNMLAQLQTLKINTMNEFPLMLGPGVAPALTSLTISSINRAGLKPIDAFLNEISFVNRTNLLIVDFDNADLQGSIPLNKFAFNKYTSLTLSRNFLEPSHSLRNFSLLAANAAQQMTTHLQSWQMLPQWPDGLDLGAAFSLIHNPVMRGFGLNISCTTASCPLPETTFCLDSSTFPPNGCTQFWLLEQWVTSQNTILSSPPDNPISTSVFPTGPIRVYAVLVAVNDSVFTPWSYGVEGLPNTVQRRDFLIPQLSCGLITGGGMFINGKLAVIPTAIPTVWLANCDFIVPAPLNKGQFGIFSKMSGTTQGFNSDYDSSGSSSTIITFVNTTCRPGTCGTGGCAPCPADSYGAGGLCSCQPCRSNEISIAGSEQCSLCIDGSIKQYDTPKAIFICVLCPSGKFSDGTICQDCPPGNYANISGSTTCNLCDPGTFTGRFGAPNCDVCPPGKTTNQTGQFACVDCDIGRYSFSPTECEDCLAGTEATSSGTGVCDPCQKGFYYSPGNNPTGCVACRPGSQQNQTGMGYCDDCPPGSSAAKPQTVDCPLCQLGSYSLGGYVITCLLCSEGSYQNVSGESSCKLCDPGSYTVFLGQGACAKCGLGTFTNVTNSTICSPCEIGRFANVWGLTKCLDCAPGNYSKYPMVSECETCARARYTNQPGQSNCLLCEPGKFGNTTGSSFCNDCEVGSETASQAMTECTLCGPGRAGFRCKACAQGRFQTEIGQANCSECPAGTYSNAPSSNTGATGCLNCPVGTFGSPPRGNLSSCVECPSSSTSAIGSPLATNCTCTAGTYGTAVNGSAPICRECPTCATCPGGEKPQSPAGCFLIQSSESLSLWNGVTCSPESACLGNQQCAPEYVQAPLCNICRPNHYRVDGKCVTCPSNAGGFWVLMLLLLLVITLCLLRFSRPNLSKINSIGIFLSGVQIISVFGYLPIPYPATTVNMFNALSVANFNLDLFSPECSTQMTFYGLWVFKLCLPLFFGAALAIIFLSIKFIPPVRPLFYKLMGDVDPRIRGKLVKDAGNSSPPPLDSVPGATDADDPEIRWGGGQEVSQDYIPSDTDRFVYCIVSLMSLLYTFLSTTASQPFQCVAVGLDFVLARDASQRCYTSEWEGYAGLGGLMIMFYTAGIPCLLFYFLFRGNQENKLHEPEFLARFGSLVVAYRSQFYFWEIVDMLRKAGVVLCVAFLPAISDADKTLQVNLIFLLTFGFFLAQVMTNPFEYNFCNRLCFVWLTTTLLTLVSALLFQSPGVDAGDVLAYAIFLLFIVLFSTAVTIYVAVREIRRAYWRAMMEKRTGVSTISRRKMQRALLGQIFEGFSHDVWRKMRIYNDEESLKFFHYLAQGLQAPEQEPEDSPEELNKMDGIPIQRAAAKSIAAKRNLMSEEDLEESDRIAQRGAIELVRVGGPVPASI